MKRVGEKIITLSEDSAMILCYDEEEHKENVRRAVTKTEIEEVAKNLIKENIDINIISSVTGLSIEELKK